ncbi:hypothetical protein OESDEN_15178, partial [Oesophagostomum dentatum]
RRKDYFVKIPWEENDTLNTGDFRYTSDPETEYSVSEMETINTIITEKITSSSFEEKKDACNVCIGLLEGIKLV